MLENRRMVSHCRLSGGRSVIEEQEGAWEERAVTGSGAAVKKVDRRKRVKSLRRRITCTKIAKICA